MKKAAKKVFISTAIALVIITVTLMGSVLLVELLADDFGLYKQESSCVRNLVAQRVKRSEIKTEKGTCYVKSNIKSNSGQPVVSSR